MEEEVLKTETERGFCTRCSAEGALEPDILLKHYQYRVMAQCETCNGRLDIKWTQKDVDETEASRGVSTDEDIRKAAVEVLLNAGRGNVTC